MTTRGLVMSIGQFFQWWGAELASMLPRALRRRLERRHDTLRLTLEGTQAVVLERDDERLVEMGRVSLEAPDAREAMQGVVRRFAAHATRVEVAVPADRLLVKEIRLPLAAEENLAQVLGFEMQRHTPFRAEQVYFNHRVTARDPAAQMLAVRVALAPRASVQPLLGLLGDWGLEQADARSRDDGDDGVLEFVSRDFDRSAASGLNRALIALNAALLAAVVAIPLIQQQRLLDDLRVRLDASRDAAKAAVALEERIAAERERIAFLHRAKTMHPAVVELIESLSRRLPDDTWLYRLELREGRIEFQGTSSAASALIAALEASGAFEDVRFGSPVTQDAGDGRERFHVSARIAPRAPAARESSG